MYYQTRANNNGSRASFISVIDPFVVQTLQSILGARLVVDTVRGSIQGNLVDVKPDHIVIKDNEGDKPIFIRIQQIVSIMPIGN